MKLLLVVEDSPLQGGLQRFTADASHELQQLPRLAWGELAGLSRRMGELLLARQEPAGLEGSLDQAELQEFDLLELLDDLIRCYAPRGHGVGAGQHGGSANASGAAPIAAATAAWGWRSAAPLPAAMAVSCALATAKGCCIASAVACS